MGAVLGACSAACCAVNLACCCGSAACGLCCKACPTCKNSTSTRIVYALFLLSGLIASCIVLIPGLREDLDKIPHFCEVSIKIKLNSLWFHFALGAALNVMFFIRTGPYVIMPTLLCFKKTIAITIYVLWDCGALFFLLRGFFGP